MLVDRFSTDPTRYPNDVTVKSARKVVAANARGDNPGAQILDAVDLMRMLGLMPDQTSEWNLLTSQQQFNRSSRDPKL